MNTSAQFSSHIVQGQSDRHYIHFQDLYLVCLKHEDGTMDQQVSLYKPKGLIHDWNNSQQEDIWLVPKHSLLQDLCNIFGNVLNCYTEI